MNKDIVLNMKLAIFRLVAPIENAFAYNRMRRKSWVSKEASAIPERTKVLDVGAGGCPHRVYFRHCEYYTQDFVKLSPVQIQKYTHTIDEDGYGAVDFVSDILNIPVSDASFDVILCTEVIEHVPHPIEAIKEMSRILRPGGLLLITAPLQSGLHQEPYHFYGGYTKYWYHKFLVESGFDNIKIEANGSLHTTYFSLGLTVFKGFLETIIGEAKLKVKIVAIISLLLFGPLLLILNPLFCFFWENIFRNEDFTAGYHVKATKKSSP
jgi:SAM-dependent methyltransferase